MSVVLDVFGVDGVWIMKYWWFFTFHCGVWILLVFLLCVLVDPLLLFYRAFWNSTSFP